MVNIMKRNAEQACFACCAFECNRHGNRIDAHNGTSGSEIARFLGAAKNRERSPGATNLRHSLAAKSSHYPEPGRAFGCFEVGR